MVVPRLDWKNQPGYKFNLTAIVVAVVLFAVYFYLWWTEGGGNYLVLWIVFVMWLIAFFTHYWQPILYLVFAPLVAILTLFSLLIGDWGQPIDQTASLLTLVFLVLLVNLFFHEEGTQ
ncbi:hypothetical protein [Halorarum salinum]|uniref:hypothetical protein n=1 Tax=Halorarum salinum TaxID=2743089 RepID=UPI001C52F2E3|nr:hypothetical protein [Halobaculum salinum]